MILFVTSDKGGTGRSVTSCNVLYRRALRGDNVCYVDFDFGSPTAGGIFGIDQLRSGIAPGHGTHSYLFGEVSEPEHCDVWTMSDRASVRNRPSGAGRMVLLPGDAAGSEFPVDDAMILRCGKLFQRLEEEFELVVVDLSSGRSYATQMALAVTGGRTPAVREFRWLVFHRWTRQHVVAASGLVYGDAGILDSGRQLGHERAELLEKLRFVRTASINLGSEELDGLRSTQLAWLNERNQELLELARDLKMAQSLQLASVPLDPIFQWEEQLLTDSDIYGRQVANPATVEAFDELAVRITDPKAWERL